MAVTASAAEFNSGKVIFIVCSGRSGRNGSRHSRIARRSLFFASSINLSMISSAFSANLVSSFSVMRFREPFGLPVGLELGAPFRNGRPRGFLLDRLSFIIATPAIATQNGSAPKQRLSIGSNPRQGTFVKPSRSAASEQWRVLLRPSKMRKSVSAQVPPNTLRDPAAERKMVVDMHPAERDLVLYIGRGAQRGPVYSRTVEGSPRARMFSSRSERSRGLMR